MTGGAATGARTEDWREKETGARSVCFGASGRVYAVILQFS